MSRPHDVVRDLVAYLIVEVPAEDALAAIVPALVDLVDTAKVRILDLVVVVKDAAGAITVREYETVESVAPLRDVEGEVGGLLSDHDVALASSALRPGTAGLVVVTEDRWADSLSTAARRAGGQIVAGERIPPSQVDRALAHRSDDEQGERS